MSLEVYDHLEVKLQFNSGNMPGHYGRLPETLRKAELLVFVVSAKGVRQKCYQLRISQAMRGFC